MGALFRSLLVTSLSSLVLARTMLSAPKTPIWIPLPPYSSAGPRQLHSAVWDGADMLIFGGIRASQNRTLYSDAFAFNPTARAWRVLKPLDSSLARFAHTAVWTGSQMIVWGGAAGNTLNSGAAYDPSSDTWTPTTLTGAPLSRYLHNAEWTGSKMWIWGGLNLDVGALDTGALYDPSSDSWTPTTQQSAPGARFDFTSVWTGSRVLLFGGYRSSDTSRGFWGDGYSYDPARDEWQTLPTSGAPSARALASGVWTGRYFIVWGGLGIDASTNSDAVLNDGAMYDSFLNRWRPITKKNAPSPRFRHTAIWTGSRMVIFGGAGEEPVSGGSLYNPVFDSWTPLPKASEPVRRTAQTAVWTGSEMILWGGSDGSGAGGELSDGAILEWVKSL